jgi:hypothetical protein
MSSWRGGGLVVMIDLHPAPQGTICLADARRETQAWQDVAGANS